MDKRKSDITNKSANAPFLYKRALSSFLFLILMATVFLNEAVAQPVAVTGYQISLISNDAAFAGRHLAALTVNPANGDLYVAVDDKVCGFTCGFSLPAFELFRVTAGVATSIGTYTFGHNELAVLAWGPDNLIYTTSTSGSTPGYYTINPTTGVATFYAPFNFSVGRHNIFFSTDGRLFRFQEATNFYEVFAGSGEVFLGSYSFSDSRHGDRAGVQPDGDFVVFSDLGSATSPGNATHEVKTAGHVAGTSYTNVVLTATNLWAAFDPGFGHSNGTIDPLTGDAYHASGNFGRGAPQILKTPATSGDLLTSSVTELFVDNIGNGDLTNDGRNAFGVTDLRFGPRPDGSSGQCLYFLDDFNDQIWASCKIINADLSVTKTDSPDPVIAGTQLNYTVTVSNAGPANAANVVATDTLPAGVSLVSTSGCAEDPTGAPTCSLGSIAAGGSAQYTITVTVDPGVVHGTTLSNSVSVTSTTPLINTGDDSTSEGTLVNTEADLSITKTDNPDSVVAGETLTYTVTVNNAGPSDAQLVQVTDTLPAGVTNPTTTGCSEDPGGVPACSLGSIAAGGSAQYTILLDVDASTLGVITNSATVSSVTLDPNSGNETASENTTVVDVADLSITKLDNTDPIIAGGNALLVYTIEVLNSGPSDARNVSVFDHLSPLLSMESTAGCSNDPHGVPDCDLGYLAVGNTVQYTITSRILRSDDLITNTATASTSATDPEVANNVASQDTQLDAIGISVDNPIALILLVLLISGFGWRSMRHH